jgi:hypothetical protein
MQAGSQVLIVENNNTHVGDFEFYNLTEKQQQQLQEVVNKTIRN